MSKRFKGIDAKVTVAVNFSESCDKVINLGEQYALRTGASLRLVHVCENFSASNWSTMMAGELVLTDVLENAQQKAKVSAENRLYELKRKINPKLNVTTSVLVGNPSEMIVADARSNQIGMIMVGASPRSHRFVPRGISTALSLMGESPVPVLVISANDVSRFDRERLRFIIADDLREHSLAAVSGGCDLAFALGRTDVHHVHINGTTLDALRFTLENALASTRSAVDPAVSAREIYDMTIKHLENKLELRVKPSLAELESAQCTYQKALLTAPSVTERLEKYVEEIDGDVVVFGRHHTFHRKPFLVGQMPFYAMLSLRCPVVVMPS